MAENTKTVAEFEKAKGYIVLSKKPDTKISEADFDDLIVDKDANKVTVVLHKERSEWLRANGYEVTRENMADATLAPAVQE